MIFCVEDDAAIRELIVYTLSASGFAAEGFSCADTFWQALEREKPQLVLLDIMLPGEDGISILRRLRARAETKKIPIILASAKGSEYDKVIGLDLGADDYLAKPFGMMEMVSRIRAVLRRSQGQEERDAPLCIGALQLKPKEHTASLAGERLHLTLKEYELLRLFMENPGRVFTREQLLAQVWGVEYLGETRSVDVHVGTLRTKLGSFGEMIVTVRGVGYRMEGER